MDRASGTQLIGSRVACTGNEADAAFAAPATGCETENGSSSHERAVSWPAMARRREHGGKEMHVKRARTPSEGYIKSFFLK